MNKEKYGKYICWGVTFLIVIALSVLLVFFLSKFDKVREAVQTFLEIMAPIIYGAVFAYLLAPVYNQTRDAVVTAAGKISGDTLHPERFRGLGSFAAVLISVLVWIFVVVGLISMLIPQLIQSIVGIIEELPSSFSNLQYWLEGLLEDNPQLESTVMEYYAQLVRYFQDWVTNDLMPNVRNIISGVYSGVFTAINVIKNLLIGIIVMVYLLNMKEKLISQFKMILYSIFPLRIANKVLEEGRYAHQVFGGFILGKLVDSLIIGVLSFILLNMMNMPYVLLVSVIIGVTNVIPFFGPFIGAIPSAFLILLESPMQCLYFCVFILLLQQFDGNILGPKILGNSTGVSSFWVLFSILLFGGLFGFAGMIIGVPTFAILYRLIKELVFYLLGRKRLSANIGCYENLNYIDEEQKTYIKK